MLKRLATLGIPCFLALFASCGDDGGDLGPVPPQAPGDNPGVLDGTWTLSGATCNGGVEFVPPTPVTLGFANESVTATSNAPGGSCRIQTSGQVSYPDASTFEVANATTDCSPQDCSSACEGTEDRRQSFSYTLQGDELTVQVSDDDFIPENCGSDQVATLSFLRQG